MTTTGNVLTVLETCRVSPQPATVGDKSLPLTFMDLQWLTIEPIPKLYFYDFPHSTSHFATTIIPDIKHSLSIALHHFFPLAGNLIVYTTPKDHSSVPPKPEIRYVEGDSVPLTFAECSLEYEDLVGYHPRHCDKFYPLIPSLERTTKISDYVKVPVFSVQVTLFPNHGISIGVTIHHVVCDASSAFHFMMAWALIAQSGNDESFLAKASLPLYDRPIKYPPSLDEIFLHPGVYRIFSEECQLPSPVSPTDKVRQTFVLKRSDVNRLKTWVSTRLPSLEYLSSFSATAAYVWSCIAKSRVHVGENGPVDENELEQFIIGANGRAHLEPPIPKNYFGNCIIQCFARTKKVLLSGDKGFLVAAEAIGKAMSKLVKHKDEVLKDAETWVDKFMTVKTNMLVSGTPKVRFSEVDFGWGKARKHEILSLDFDGGFSIDACKDSPEDIEVGFVFPRNQMDAFATIFTSGLAQVAFLGQE